ncbi:MAG: polysaccharide deacetylase family protein [Clostridia bacterium]|nr:polysaccharide deacetylase family protein [Clostridia bacterium]
MKRILVLLLAACFILTTGAYADTVKMYSLDGRETYVDSSEVESLKSVGWYENFEEVTTTIFAPDGRTALIYKAELENYLALGWFEKYEDVAVTVYAPDGRYANVYIADLPAYKAQGWYDKIEDVTATVYALDGRQATVYKAEVPAYKSVGWYDKYEDVVMKIYAPGGVSAVIYKADWPAYKAQGWYDTAVFADPSRPMVAFTYDDGPSQYTSSILDTLSANGCRATFFVVGQNAAVYKSTIAREASLGMEIGNHTYSHPDLTKQSYGNIQSQISRTDTAVYNACGQYTRLMRPPYGSQNSTVRSAVGKPLILWSVDTRDWESRNADKVVANILNNVKDGDIILMHDLYPSTAAATARIVPELVRRGYQIVTVSELARCKGVNLQSGGTYSAIR